jgi:hypothetical protein
MFRILRSWHTAFKARMIRYFRTREVVKVFSVMHAEELRLTPIENWPLVKARQNQEIRMLRAGQNLIVDRKSWAFPYLPSCLDDQTEILTKRGFIPVTAMKRSDMFATRHPVSHRFEWQRAGRIVRSRYKGEMVEMLGQQLDVLVTPNHRVVNIQKTEGIDRLLCSSSEQIDLAGDLSTTNRRSIYALPLTAKPDKSYSMVPQSVVLTPIKRNIQDRNSLELDIPFEVWVQFLALYLAEGCCDGTTEGIEFGTGVSFEGYEEKWNKLLADFEADPFEVAERRRNNKYRVRIACAEGSEIRKDVAELLAQMPNTWTPNKFGFDCGCKALWMALFPFGHCWTKYVPDDVKNLPVEHLGAFLDWLMKTDGYSAHGDDYHQEYGTTSRRFAEDVQEILLRLGYQVGVRTKLMDCGSTFYRISFSREQYCNVRSIRRVDYDGYVYCPSVPNGIICVRRNGKIHWTGNSVQRLSMPVSKSTPFNLRRFSRTPVARRAINLIKNSVTAQAWDVRPIDGIPVDDPDEQAQRIKIAKAIFNHPNNTESHQSELEMEIEDLCIMGASATELRLTLDPKRPLKMWPMDASTVRIFVSWSESTPDLPHYAQMTGLQGERGAILFYDDEIMYIKDNPATDNPFGLGKLETAFQVVNDLLGVQRMSGMAGSDQTRKNWLWWEQPQTDEAFQIVRRHIQNELEGQAKVSLIGGMKKPDVLEITPVTIDDLLLPWHEMLIRMIANAFDMSAMALGIEHDVNRAVGDVLKDSDFRSAVVPMAKRIQEARTRKILHNKLGWYDLEYVFLSLDDPDLETKTDMNARMYSANALTPNEWRLSVGKQPLKSSFADLTQFEAMMLNQELMAQLTDQSAQKTFDRQQSAQQSAPAGGAGGEGPKPPSQGSISRGGQIESPKPMALPKFPIAGTKWNAREIAQMPVNDLAQRIDGGELPHPKKLLIDMQNQDPNILEQMSDQVKDYFKHVLDDEASEDQDEEIPQKTLDQMMKELRKRTSKQNNRSDDMTQYLQDVNQRWKMATPGKPGAKTYRAVKNPGKPGTPPAARSL